MKQETLPQGKIVNQELKAAFRDEVKAIESLLIEHNLIKDFTPVGELVVPVNISFAAPAIAIARLLSGYWVGSIETIFEYALYNLKHSVIFEDIEVPISPPATKDKIVSDVAADS